MVIGLGASAGGIGALRRFFAHVPEGTGHSYVVILHLSPDHDSQLAHVLQGVTSMPVTQVTQTTALEANHVYVIPPNRSLEVADGHLTVSEISNVEQRRSPVDVFFRALADALGAEAAAVVLSGTGHNGSAGIKRIKEHGGIVVAQDPEQAEFSEMPRNAIATRLVDFIQPVEAIPATILAFQQRHEQGDTTDAAEMSLAEAAPEILRLLRARTGHDFSNYKAGTALRRIERRVHILGFSSMTDYLRVIADEPDEAAALMKELLVSVTNFFRDADAWAVVQHLLVPRMFENKTESAQVRVWVPGCATGEEAYSVAMLLAEYAEGLAERPSVQVFGSDLDERAIAAAREGIYTGAEVADLSEERLNRFFQRVTNGGYRVRRELRETVLFAHHNVITDPPFSHLDLVSCRNLLIYLNRPLQERILETFHFALGSGGYLFLGSSESPESLSELFVPVDRQERIYEARAGAGRRPPIVPALAIMPGPRAAERVLDNRADRVFPADMHHRLLDAYAPPSLVVNEDFAIVHVSERAAKYLQAIAGEPSRDLLKVVREELRVDLRAALHRAAARHSEVEVEGVRVALPEGDEVVNLLVRPVLRDGDPARGFFLVLFDGTASSRPATAISQKIEPSAAVDDLEHEVTRLKAQLLTRSQMYESQAEDATAANEELQAMNEELRSTAEELETSKEELQSLNEELSTVNQELKVKIDELALTNSDFQNLINSTEIGTVFLDRSLRIKLTTPRAADLFNLRRIDIGRPLSDITSSLLYDRLHDDVAGVLQTLQTIDREVQTRDGGWFQMRVFPYRTLDDRIDGVVLTFHDITQRRRAEERVSASEERLRLVIDSATDYAIITVGVDGRVASWTTGAERMFGYRADEIVGLEVAELFTPEDRRDGVPARDLREATLRRRTVDERVLRRKDGTTFFASGVTAMIANSDDFVIIARDLSIERQAAAALAEAHHALEERVTERTAELSGQVLLHAEAERRVGDLLRKVVTSQEDERARIARDLHDQLGQRLTALHLSLERHRSTGASSGSPSLDQAFGIIDEVDADVEFLAWELRPATLDHLGLAAALPRFVEQWSARSGVTTHFGGAGVAAGELTKDAEVAFYRIAQESLNNVSKHAHASRVDVILETRDGSVMMVIEDNGDGFDPAEPAGKDGIGLAGMRERAALVGATLEIESRAGHGTTIFLRCRSAIGDGCER